MSDPSASQGSETPGLRRLTSEEFRDVIGHFASGVTVITAVDGGQQFGTTASAVTSLSLEPPMVLVCMNKTSETGRAISADRRFAVNILGEDQAEAAVRFASKGSDKFDGVPVVEGEWGEPLLSQALATLECRVTEETTGGTHSVFLAEVDRGSAQTDPGAPLAYFRGQFGRLELTQNVQPVTLESIEEALRARAAIELGVAAQRVGTLSDEELATARRLSDALGRSNEEDGDEWLADLKTFSDYMVELAGSPSLLDAYRRVNAPALVAALRRAADGEDVAAAEGAQRYHVRLVDAYAAGDLPAAVGAITERTERTIGRLPDIVGAAGGA